MKKIHLEQVYYHGCNKCMFFSADEGDNEIGESDDEGFCERFPPTADGWPRVEGNHRCGEWRINGWTESQIEEVNFYRLMPEGMKEKIEAAFALVELHPVSEFEPHLAFDDNFEKSGISLEVLSWMVHARIQLSLEVSERWVNDTKPYREENFDLFWEYLS